MHHSFCIIVCYRAVRSAILATAGLLVSLRVSVRVRVRVSISIYLIDGIKLRIGSVLTNNIRRSANPQSAFYPLPITLREFSRKISPSVL